MSETKLAKSALAGAILLVLVTACSAETDADEAGVDNASSTTQQSSDGSTNGGGGTDSASGSGTSDDDGSDATESDEGDGADDTQDDDTEPKRDYDGLPKSGKQQSPVLSQIPGNNDASCVDTSGMRNARSGSIAAGPFDQVDQSYGTKVPGKPRRSIRIYWIPMSSNPDGLTVRVTKAGGGPTSTVKKSQVSDADKWKFFDTNIPISEPGTWVLRARSGSNHGCFEVTVS